jgi:hypothetical protein
MSFFLFVSSFFDAKLGRENRVEKMLMPGGLLRVLGVNMTRISLHLYLMQSRVAKILVPAEKMLMPGGLLTNFCPGKIN